MTEIEKKALALLNECAGQEVHGGWKTFDPNLTPCTRALIRAIEQHEAFRREVSDAVEAIAKAWGTADPAWGYLRRFIILQPDPLVEVLDECGFGVSSNAADDIRAAIEKRGGKIVWGEGA